MIAARQAQIAVLLRQGQVIAVQLSSMPNRICNNDQAQISCSGRAVQLVTQRLLSTHTVAWSGAMYSSVCLLDSPFIG